VGIKFIGHPKPDPHIASGWLERASAEKDYDMNTEQFVTIGENGDDV